MPPSQDSFTKNLPSIGKISLIKSNSDSLIIKYINKSKDVPFKERFLDLLITDFNTLKLMTNAYIDIQRNENSPLIFLFSSMNDKIPRNEFKSLREFSEQCKYRLDPEMREFTSLMQPFQQMLTSSSSTTINNLNLQLPENKRNELLYCLKDFYGTSLETQINQGILDKINIVTLSDISHEDYEEIIKNIIKIEIGSVLQHISWCKNHDSAPYAILSHGHNEIGNIKCPICEEDLNNGRFVSLHPDFNHLLKSHGGFLPLIVGWYLTKNKFDWTADVKINGEEYGDLIFRSPNEDRLFLIECKTHGRDKKMRGYDKTLEKDLKQLISHIEYWERKDVKIDKAHIITNYIGDENWISIKNSVINKFKKEISSRKIKIHPIRRIKDIISEIIE